MGIVICVEGLKKGRGKDMLVKRAVSVFLSLVLMVGLCPALGLAAEGGSDTAAHTQLQLTTQAAKQANPLTVKAKSPSVLYSKTSSKTIAASKAFSVSNAQGKVSYKKVSGNGKIAVASNGKITVKKGLKAGTYPVKVKVAAKGNSSYRSGSKTVTVKVKVVTPITPRTGCYTRTVGDPSKWGGTTPVEKPGYTFDLDVKSVSGRTIRFSLFQVFFYGTCGYYEVGTENNISATLDANNVAKFSFRTYGNEYGTGVVKLLSKNKLKIKLIVSSRGRERMIMHTGEKYITLTYKG